jgi:hypothetical protein
MEWFGSSIIITEPPIYIGDIMEEEYYYIVSSPFTMDKDGFPAGKTLCKTPKEAEEASLNLHHPYITKISVKEFNKLVVEQFHMPERLP